MATDDRRETLGATFDRAARLYQRARPEYPDELIDDFVRRAELAAGDRLLEVGCATGKATLPLARRGFRITCLEPGVNLVTLARRNLAGLQVEIVETTLEDWASRGRQFDAVFAATAWHWVDPAVRYRKAWEVIRPGGHLAFWSALHVLPDNGDPFFRDIQGVYSELGEGLPAGREWQPRPGELPDGRGEVEESGLFETTYVRHFDWEQRYDADGYIELLDTFSGHIAMDGWKRERLYAEIRRQLGQRPDGTVRRHWGAVLHIARRRDPDATDHPG